MKFTIKWYFRRYSEKVILWIVWRLPRTIVYWAAVRLMAFGPGNPGETKCIDALKAWEGKR